MQWTIPAVPRSDQRCHRPHRHSSTSIGSAPPEIAMSLNARMSKLGSSPSLFARCFRRDSHRPRAILFLMRKPGIHHQPRRATGR